MALNNGNGTSPNHAVPTEVKRVPVASSGDIVAARQGGRTLGSQLKFSASELTMIATAISEIARNIVEYAGKGEILLKIVHSDGRRGLSISARDHGPGIPDVVRAMQAGYTTGKGLGLGLPGARQLMDEFAISSSIGKGTVVTMKKWEPWNIR